MTTPVTDVRNIGPAMADAFERADIVSAEELRALGADAAYRRLIETGTRPHFIGYYALVMGLQGRPWNDCQGQEKTELRARFDALVATARPNENRAMAQALDEVGVILHPDQTQSDGREI